MPKPPDSRVLNVVCSSLIVAVGIAIYWFAAPPVFTKPFIIGGFQFWLIQWVLWIASYGMMQSKSPDVHSILTIIDLNTTLGLGLCIALLMGDKFNGTTTLINLTLVFGLLVGWNFLCGTWMRERPTVTILQTLWLLPSMTLSLVSLVGWAVFSVHRYQWHAVPFAAVAVIYALIQQPSYKIVFLGKHESGDDNWITYLAVGKLLLGLTFYSFILDAPKTEANWNPNLGGVFGNPVVEKVLLATVSALTSFVLSRIMERVKDSFGPKTPPPTGTATVTP